MALQHFPDQHLDENTPVRRTILPQQLHQPSPEEAGKAPENQHRPPPQVGVGPTWLNSGRCAGLERFDDGLRDIARIGDLNNDNNNNRAIGGNRVENNGGVGGELMESDVAGGGGGGVMNWQNARIDAQLAQSQNVVAKYSALGQGNIGDDKELDQFMNARYKSEILSHPLYKHLLSAHVACLRIAMPVDQLPRIDAQLAQSQNVVAKYSALGQDISINSVCVDAIYDTEDEFSPALVVGACGVLANCDAGGLVAEDRRAARPVAERGGEVFSFGSG
ncbi:homeobox protein knotted-1-like 4 [Actinidia rufa]|uniref:Homeobox protein knotted-1-like 4 n=1 Tax=Actinidia rufa TaxID=165716 RepID=A0A7J0DC71_9ERIC|nr:homeobox protein knotted-1-like 4 [Actinidia rufa]